MLGAIRRLRYFGLNRLHHLAGACVLGWSLAGSASASNQTDTVSPVYSGSGLPFRVEVREVGFGSAVIPTLHSYAAGEHDGKWVLVGGRTNGIHGFENSGGLNFPQEYRNREVWVIDPETQQTWSRALDDLSDSGLTTAQVDYLSTTNNQFMQVGDRLYMTGGYTGSRTHNVLSAIDLPGLVDWVVNDTGDAASHMRFATDSAFQVTGGAMYEIEGRTHLVFGQNFTGGYVPGKTGAYTNQVRSFDIVDDGNTLSIANYSETTPAPEYHRRDLNVYPVLRPDGNGGVDTELVVLSGVFTPTVGAWTVPVEIDAAGQPSMADPNDPNTFRQPMNNYHSAKAGLYSPGSGAMHELLFGGITLQYYDEATNSFIQDDDFPFVNDITSVSIDASGDYTQYLVGEFPEILDVDNKALRFGANAEFFVHSDVPTLGYNIVNLDALTGETSVGYIYGGIFTNGPHTRGVADVDSAASGLVFEVLVTPVADLTGDYNGDGVVDLADYTVWRNTLGATGNLLAADGNGDFVVNTADYQMWKQNFGNSVATWFGSPVPEPTTLTLLAIGGLAVVVRRWC